jgi:hypothetical protein
LDLGHGAFFSTNLADISLGAGNVSFKIIGHLLLNYECTSIIQCFGRAEAIIIPGGIGELCCHCFYGNKFVSSVTFEPRSKLSRIERGAFAACYSLASICIPSSVEMLSEDCFLACKALSSVTFEAG